MTTFPRAESRRSYSWWWDSHISPKNSKWLQENLTDMDLKVKAMIKLIEEDADSFARRAEMYYKKRPELMKLVEEFYRAYRALAERYDHATGALRHAHRTMSEAFPNHIPFALPDESLSNNTSEIPSPGAFGASTPSIAFDSNGPDEDSEMLATKKGKQHFNETEMHRDGAPRVKLPERNEMKDLNAHEEDAMPRVRLPEWKIRKSLNFDEGEISPHAKVFIDSKSHLLSDSKENEGVRYGLKHLQEQVSLLSSENQNLKVQIELESKHLYLSRAEVQNLREEMPKLEAEKDTALHQQQLSNEIIYKLEIEVSDVKSEIRKLNEEMESAVLKLSGAEEQCIALEKANQRLQLELDEAKIKLEELKVALNESNEKCMEAEMSFQSSEQLYGQSNEEAMLMAFEIQSLVEILRELGCSKVRLEEDIFLLKNMNFNLNEHNLACALKLKHLEDEMILLKEKNGKLEDEIENQEEGKLILQQELKTIKEEKKEIDIKHQSVSKEMEAASLHIESLVMQMKNLQFRHGELKEGFNKLEDEKLLFLRKLRNMESVYQRNLILENSLTDANVELDEFREKFTALEGKFDSLNAVLSTQSSEKRALTLQIDVFVGNVEKLSDKNTFLENSLHDANTELESLRLKLRDLEEAHQSMSHTHSELIEEKNNLLFQVENVQQSLANLEATHGILEDKHMNVVKEKDASANKILDLERSLIALQKEHKSLICSKNVSLATLENQLHFLQDCKQAMEEELESEHLKGFSDKFELFILNRFLIDLSNLYMIEKRKHKSFVQSSETQLSDFKNQIHLLQKEIMVRNCRIEEEEQKSITSMFSNLILQRSLSELQGENFTLFQQCQKHLESSRCAEGLIKKLEDRELGLKEKGALLMDHISKVRDSIKLVLKPLNINKELMSNQGSEEAILQIILGEINTLLSSISEFHDKNNLLCLEISIYQSLLKQTELENVHLRQELEITENQSLTLHREHRQLFEEYEQLYHNEIATDFTNIALKSKLQSFTTKLVDSLKKVYELRQEKNALNEENSSICVEVMTLEHLYLFFRNLNAESMQQLKLLRDDMQELLFTKNGLDEEIRESKARAKAFEDENKQLKESPILLEDFRSFAVVSEFDKHVVRSFCDEVILQVKADDELLKEKSLNLLKVNSMLQYKQEEVTEVYKKLEISKKEADEAKFVKNELENKIALLLEGSASKDNQICNVNEDNRTLNEEIDKFKTEVKAHKMMEQHLLNELQDEKKQVAQFEKSLMDIYGKVQASVINEFMLDEKMLELASRCEGFEILAMLLRETLKEKAILKITHGDELNRKLDDYEKENARLRTNLKVLYPLFFSLGNAISYVKEQFYQLEVLTGYQEKSPYHEKNFETITGNLDIATMPGVLELQNLIAEVVALQKLVAGIKGNHHQEKLLFAAKLESARKEIEELKLKEISFIDENQTRESSNMVKDIELDQISSSFAVISTNCGNLPSADQDIEAVEGAKLLKPSSEHTTDKDGVTYRKGILRENQESQEEWNSWVLKRLTFISEKLTVLQANAQGLKHKMAKYNDGASQNRQQFDTIRVERKQAEDAISDLAERNRKLLMMVHLYSNSAKEMGRAERSQVLEQLRSASDRIGMLELELQKIDYIFLKLEEDWESYSAGGKDRTPRVLLKDYLYGRNGRHGKKMNYFCGCTRPRTLDNY